jgi:agmatine deiminase
VNVSDYQRIEATVDHLRTLQNAYGRPYRIIRIPMPPSATGNYPPNSSYFTYTNSLIVNKTVLVPVYGFALDATALQIYRDAMPGYNVIGYDCNAIIGQSGAIHCIVKEVGVREPVLIAHARLDDTADITAAHRIEATIRVRSGVDSAFVFWRTDSTAAFTASQMTDSAGAFIAEIPPQPAGTPVWYYIQSHTGTGRAVTKPVTGAQGAYKFTVLDTTVTSVRGGEQPLLFTLSQNYPNPFNPSTTIGFQVTAYSHVRLSIYDLLGREVATLVNRQMEPGSYHAEWNATGVASGVYVIRLVATAANGSTHIAARKAMLMK